MDAQRQLSLAVYLVSSFVLLSTPSEGLSLCPFYCGPHASCKSGSCVCDLGWGGQLCSTKLCIPSCASNQICDNGTCVCAPGWAGSSCDTRICTPLCGPRQLCSNGTCVCQPGLQGSFCDCTTPCVFGSCATGSCKCLNGYYGEQCQYQQCSTPCAERHTCNNGTCVCASGWKGTQCSQAVCALPCEPNGVCRNGRCLCNHGYGGKWCDQRIGDPCDCTGHGSCINGECICAAGYSGVRCKDFQPACSGNDSDAVSQCSAADNQTLSLPQLKIHWDRRSKAAIFLVDLRVLSSYRYFIDLQPWSQSSYQRKDQSFCAREVLNLDQAGGGLAASRTDVRRAEVPYYLNIPKRNCWNRNGLDPLNRSLYDSSDGQYDRLCGTFYVTVMENGEAIASHSYPFCFDLSSSVEQQSISSSTSQLGSYMMPSPVNRTQISNERRFEFSFLTKLSLAGQSGVCRLTNGRHMQSSAPAPLLLVSSNDISSTISVMQQWTFAANSLPASLYSGLNQFNFDVDCKGAIWNGPTPLTVTFDLISQFAFEVRLPTSTYAFNAEFINSQFNLHEFSVGDRIAVVLQPSHEQVLNQRRLFIESVSIWLCGSRRSIIPLWDPPQGFYGCRNSSYNDPDWRSVVLHQDDITVPNSFQVDRETIPGALILLFTAVSFNESIAQNMTVHIETVFTASVDRTRRLQVVAGVDQPLLVDDSGVLERDSIPLLKSFTILSQSASIQRRPSGATSLVGVGPTVAIAVCSAVAAAVLLLYLARGLRLFFMKVYLRAIKSRMSPMLA